MRTAESYVVHHNGKPVYPLNQRLAERQGVTDKELANLVALHEIKLFIFDKMNETDDVGRLRAFASIFEDIEFAMQRNWHFSEDKRMHEWYNVPKCTCPKMDNMDARGTSFQITNLSCPIHGTGE